MKSSVLIVALLAGIVALVAGALRPRPAIAIASAALPQEAYVWQRAWTPAVTAAVREQAPGFAALPVLAAEVKWINGRPEATRIAVDHAAIQAGGVPAYPVIRVGEYAGSFAASAPAAGYLRELSQVIVREWAAAGLPPAELQLDFDCPESKLAGYRRWVETLRAGVAPARFTITALPTWLKHREFKALAAATDGYVLQVHSFQAPRTASEPYVLCDPLKTRDYVERAAALGIPFRVALPTYGYRLIFDRDGRFEGLAAEGAPKDWPADRVIREVHADPVELATLIRQWNQRRSEVLRGVVWYRLPNADDDLNWPWATLQTVMAGEIPREQLTIAADANDVGLTELTLSNSGSASTPLPASIRLHWTGARLVAGDGLAGYELIETARDGALLKRIEQTGTIKPGERTIAGWLRLTERTEVRVEY